MRTHAKNQRRGSRQLIAVCAGLAASLLAVRGGAAEGIEQASATPPRVSIDAGTLVGALDGDVATFKGVPFAKPPLGELRWQPPQKPEAWSGERAATQSSLPCYQPTQPGRANGGGIAGDSSEDCLYLNVWAPKDAKNAPVMVWFFGGANFLGGAQLYNGTSFAKHGVIVVTPNYRLGPLGFFAHPALTAAAAPDAPLIDYGNMDQTEALRWVQRNIARFGGNPQNVTIFGQSAGGSGVYTQLTSPAAKGLFQKAIVHSGSFLGKDMPLALAEQEGAALAQKAGLPGVDATLEQLRKLTPAQLSAANPRGTGPATDGRFLPEPPTLAYAFHRQIDVPFIVGSNSGEGMRGAYDRWAAAQSADGAPSFLYHFSYVPERSRASSPAGAPHSAEIRYAWNTLGSGSQVSDADRKVAETMHACWVAFAFYSGKGKLDCGNGLVWPAYSAEKDQLLEFGEKSGVRKNFKKAEWDETLRKPAAERRRQP